jgi:hypothetical protein
VGGGPVALVAGSFKNGYSDYDWHHVGHDLAVANHAGYVTILFGR